jgi:hypothetical protein
MYETKLNTHTKQKASLWTDIGKLNFTHIICDYENEQRRTVNKLSIHIFICMHTNTYQVRDEK